MKNPVPFLRITALVEAASFLVLVGIAMPLKYFWDMPIAVKVVGWTHGVLFMIFCCAWLRVMLFARWPMARGALIFFAALLPFGPFLLDRRMLRYAEEFQQKTSTLPK